MFYLLASYQIMSITAINLTATLLLNSVGNKALENIEEILKDETQENDHS